MRIYPQIALRMPNNDINNNDAFTSIIKPIKNPAKPGFIRSIQF